MSSVAVRYRNPRHRATSVHLAALRLSAKLGLLAVASHILGALFPKRDVDVQMGNGRWLTVPAYDPYWSSILVGKDYEPGVGAIIEMALEAEPDAVLFDCGANIGYWSTAVCDRTAAIAVEAVPSTYSRLERNAEQNGFVAIHAAIWDVPGTTVPITWTPRLHYAASVTNTRGKHTVDVSTATLGQLADRYASDRPIVVKLDVEGAEARALGGASACTDRCLFVYEDHGSDREHQATRAFLEAGFQIWHVDASPRPIEDVGDLDEIKRNTIDGYNFMACRGPTWSQLLRR